MDEEKTKLCRGCGRVLPITSFSICRNHYHADGKQSRCKACMRVYAVKGKLKKSKP